MGGGEWKRRVLLHLLRGGHTPSCIPCIRKLGRSRPPNRTRGPREIGGTSLAAEAESIGGGEVGVATQSGWSLSAAVPDPG